MLKQTKLIYLMLFFNSVQARVRNTAEDQSVAGGPGEASKMRRVEW